MSDGVAASITGLEGLMAELRALPALMQQRVIRGAVGTGANIIKREAVVLAPEWTGPVSKGHPPPGTLKRAIYAARLMDKCTSTTEVWIVGVRSGKAARHYGTKNSKAGPTQGKNLDAYYGRWVEYGHHVRASKSDKKNLHSGAVLKTGAYSVAPKPYMRPAFETKKNEAVQAMQDYINRHLVAAVVGNTYLKAA